MNGPDSISDPVAHRISYAGSYPSASGSAPTRLGSIRLGSTQLGSWLMTWQVVPLCWHGMLLYMLMSQLHQDDVIPGMSTVHADIIFIRVSHMGRVNWYSGRVSPSGRRRRVGRVCARGQTPCWRVMESAAMSDVRFWRRFHQWLRLVLLYTVVWSKHNFDNFHFWAKIKHHFKPYALIPIVGNSDRWCIDVCS